MTETKNFKVLAVLASVGAALAACFLVFITALEPARATAPPGENGRIAYARYESNDAQIYTISPTGGTPTKVTDSTTTPAFQPSFSPDGQRIAYITFMGNHIYTIPSSGGTSTHVIGNETSYSYTPSFSPDGQKIAYYGWDYDSNDYEIYTISPNGGTPTKVTDNTTEDSYPSFSPDSEKIAYVGTNGEDREIYTIPSNGGTPTQLTNNTVSEEYLSFSPDGQKIAYSSYDGNDYEIYTIPSDGGTPTQLTINTTSERDPSFSPDGQKIAYEGHDGSDFEIYTMPSNGGASTNVTNTTTDELQPDWGVHLPDTTPPQTSIDSGPEGPTTDNTPTFSFSGVDAETAAADLLFSYKIDDGDWSEYSSQTSVTLGGQAGLSDGSHTFYVRAKDQADNEDDSPAERTFTLDDSLIVISDVSPDEDAIGVDKTTNIQVIFDEAMNPKTLNSSTFTLTAKKGTRTTKVSGRVSYDAATKTLTLNPDKDLFPGSYTATVVGGNKGVKSATGATLLQSKSWSFTVQ